MKFSSILVCGFVSLFIFLVGVAMVNPKTAYASDVEEMEAEAEDTPTIREVRKKLRQSEQGTLHVVGHLTINNTTKEEVFDYLANLENDVHWYPGTLSSTLVSGNGGAGTVYQETVFFFEQEIPVTATVLKVKPHRSFWFTSGGVFTNLTNYRVRKAGHHKVRFTLDSTVEATNGVTQEFFEQYLTLAFQNLLTAMGKTGTIEIE
jgi:hypothetical protein